MILHRHFALVNYIKKIKSFVTVNVTFDKCDASLLNKSTHFFKTIIIIIKQNHPKLLNVSISRFPQK